jgi:GNAT superfamily N-acetyltransferase
MFDVLATGGVVPTFVIRAARREDLESIEAVFRSHEADYDWKFAKMYFRSYFSKPARHREEAVLLALFGDRVVGVIGYLPDSREARGIFWLGWFYVHRDEQGHGYGQKLLEHVVAEVKKRGARKLYTDTSSWPFYERAHRAYGKLGFKEEAMLRDFYGKGEHQVIYGLCLT